MIITCFEKEPWKIQITKEPLKYGNISNLITYKRKIIYFDIPSNLFPYMRTVLRVPNNEPYKFELYEENNLFYFLLTGPDISHPLWSYKTLPIWAK
jgi:hypothetical protein